MTTRPEELRFTNRTDAGKRLAQRLLKRCEYRRAAASSWDHGAIKIVIIIDDIFTGTEWAAPLDSCTHHHHSRNTDPATRIFPFPIMRKNSPKRIFLSIQMHRIGFIEFAHSYPDQSHQYRIRSQSSPQFMRDRPYIGSACAMHPDPHCGEHSFPIEFIK